MKTGVRGIRLEARLCDYQEAAIKRLFSAADSARSSLPSFLLIGSSGVGKRTVAERFASAYGIDFLEVRLDRSPRDVIDTLCGTADLGSDATSPGELGVAAPRLIYLSHLEGLDPSLFHRFATIVKKRVYTDRSGTEWKISDDLWLSAGLTVTNAAVNVSPNHWLTANFQTVIGVPDPLEASDFQRVAENIATERSGMKVTNDVGELIATQLLSADEHLHAIRRWITLAWGNQEERTIDKDALHGVILADLGWAIRSIEYRGRRLELRHVKRWIDQMDSKFHGLAFRLVWMLAQRYFINADAYYRGLGALIEQAQIPTDRLVCFCKWQPIGKSAPQVAHELKNRARWRIGPDFDFGAPDSSWPSLAVPDPLFVIADDFVGTGTTASKLSQKSEHSALSKLAKRYPNASFAILLLVAYENSLAQVLDDVNKLLPRPIDVYIYRMLTETDQCFSSSSTMIPSGKEREELRQLCFWARAKHFKTLDSQYALGFQNTGSFFAFFNSVPNNSLPILWHDQSSWVPLLPASGTLT